MNSIIESVNGSRRLKIYTASYLIVYTVAILVLNLIKTSVAFFSAGIGAAIYALVSLFVKAPLMYGLIRGIVKKDYRVRESLGAFFDTKAYGAYGVYVAVILMSEGLNYLVTILAGFGGAWAIVAEVISYVLILLTLLINCYLVKVYFDSIDNGGAVVPLKSFSACVRAVKTAPLKIVGVEVLLIVAKYLSLYVSALFIALLPQNWIISLVVACLNEIIYGFLILLWPIYYLYYKTIFEE